MKALVTGATGFIGANLVRALVDEGVDTLAVVRPGSENHWRIKAVKNQIQTVEADLLESQSLETMVRDKNPDYFFHLASYGTYPFQQTDTKRILETNLIGTANLFKAAVKSGFKKFIAVGSSSEYGRKDKPMREDDLLEPENAYGVSKAAASLFLLAEASSKRLPVVIFRPFSVYGPWEEPSRLFPTIIKKALSGQNLELAAPDIARDYVYVDDIVEAFLKSMGNDKVDGQVINLCSGRQTTLKQVVDSLLKVTGSKSEPLWGAHKGRSYDASIWVGDGKKAKELLGWTPETNLEEGIKKMTDWFQTHSQYYDSNGTGKT